VAISFFISCEKMFMTLDVARKIIDNVENQDVQENGDRGEVDKDSVSDITRITGGVTSMLI
jgi:hypothetical protein